jgi:2-succinyl-6-hydroxy-2,4-cyclohexadiene-1-carboxylate synthase
VDTECWVFVSGFTQDGNAFNPVRRPLQRALGYDETGLGAAPPDADSFTDAAAQLASLAAYREAEQRRSRATFVGYSQGGRLCLQLALDRPEVMQRLVLVSASPGIADATERAARVEADERLAEEVERDGVDAFIDRWLAQPLFATLPRERSGIDDRKLLNTVEHLTFQLRVLGQGAQPSNWDRLGELRMPVLLVAGGLDTKYVDLALRMAERMPDARVEIIPNAGHACHLEQPEHVAQLLASFEADHR